MLKGKLYPHSGISAACSDKKGRIGSLDFLRAIASLAVVLFHFCAVLEPGFIRSVTGYGKYGVQVFFVVSGFVIPLSLAKSGYQISDYLRFLLKRITRLHPPYVATLAVIIALGIFSWYFPFQPGPRFEFSLPQLLLHLVYANELFGYPWLSDIFWTLGVEVQFYLLLGLAFPLIFSRSGILRISTLICLGLAAFLIAPVGLVFAHLFLFIMGILICLLNLKVISGKSFAVLFAVTAICLYLRQGTPELSAGLFTAFVLLFLRINNAVFNFLGAISYSLYLTHSPIGKRALSVLLRMVDQNAPLAREAAVLMAVIFAIAAAWVFYLLFERPALRWSARVVYKSRQTHRGKTTVNWKVRLKDSIDGTFQRVRNLVSPDKINTEQ